MSWPGVATFPVEAVENCLRVCREGLQVENDNHPDYVANLSALPCVCVCQGKQRRASLPRRF